MSPQIFVKLKINYSYLGLRLPLKTFPQSQTESSIGKRVIILQMHDEVLKHQQIYLPLDKPT